MTLIQNVTLTYFFFKIPYLCISNSYILADAKKM